MPAQDSTRWWLVAEGSLATAVVVLPLCLGGAPAWTAWVLQCLASVALLTWAAGAWRHGRRATWHPLFALPLFVMAIAVVTLVPLPTALLALLAPARAELREFVLVPLGVDAASPITIDAPATLRAFARASSLLCVAFVSVQLARVPGVSRRLLSVIGVTGALVAVVGFGHLLLGAESLFGVWRFAASLPLLSFFGNSNHLAAYLAFSATVALALALDSVSREVSLGWAAVAIACGLGVFFTFSRGGIVTFLASWALVAALHFSRRQGGVRSALPWLVIGITGLIAALLASEQLIDRLASVATVERLKATKVELWPMMWSGAVAFWRTGMGLGAYELAFPRYQTAQLDVVFTHPENIVLQWCSEVGLPFAGVLLGLTAFVAVRLTRQVRTLVLESTVLVGVVGVGLHEVFDFALELNALPVAVMVASGLIGGRDREGGPEPLRRSVHRRGLMVAVALVVVGFLALARGMPPHRVAEDRLVALVDAGAPSETVRAAAIAVIERHPAAWLPFSLVADQLSREGAARESLAWVNRVLFLRPDDARAHVAAGHALLRLNQAQQALLELRVAWRLGDGTSFDEGLLLAERLGAFDRLLEEQPGALTRAWERYRVLGRFEAAQALLAAAMQLPPSPEVLLEAKVLEVWQAQALALPGRAVELLAALPVEVRSKPELVVLHATLLAQLGRASEGIALLDPVARRSPEQLLVASKLAELLGQEHRTAEAREALGRSQPFVIGSQARSALFQQEAALWLIDERWPRALEALQTASRIEPGRADLKYRIAEVYERMGSLHSALDEVRRARLLDTPEGARAQNAWVARLEAALANTAE